MVAASWINSESAWIASSRFFKVLNPTCSSAECVSTALNTFRKVSFCRQDITRLQTLLIIKCGNYGKIINNSCIVRTSWGCRPTIIKIYALVIKHSNCETVIYKYIYIDIDRWRFQWGIQVCITEGFSITMFDDWRITNPIMLGYWDVLWQESIAMRLGIWRGKSMKVPCVNPYIHHIPPWFLGCVYVFLMANWCVTRGFMCIYIYIIILYIYIILYS